MNEEELFNSIQKRNPNKGKKYDDYFIYSDKLKKVTHYKIYSWMYPPDLNILEDKLVYTGRMSIELNKLGIPLQIYYDIVVCGYTSTTERPICKYCGNPCTFKSIPSGYRIYCNDSCKKKWENKTFGPIILSEESRKKVSQSLIKMYKTEKGKKLRENISNSKKEMWKDPNSIYNDPGFRERKRQGFINLLEDPVRGKYIDKIYSMP